MLQGGGSNQCTGCTPGVPDPSYFLIPMFNVDKSRFNLFTSAFRLTVRINQLAH